MWEIIDVKLDGCGVDGSLCFDVVVFCVEVWFFCVLSYYYVLDFFGNVLFVMEEDVVGVFFFE